MSAPNRRYVVRWLGSPTPEHASSLCESGDALACATALEFEAKPEQRTVWERASK